MSYSPSVVSLFSGVGGLDLALERMWGAVPLVFAERDPYRREVLRVHWPDVPCFGDVADLDGRDFAGADIVAGGFPCQDVSNMGPKTGMAGTRSGPGWHHFARLIEEIEPYAVAIENVRALRTRGLDLVLQDLAALGYDAAWTTVEARAAGLSIHRPRLFVLALANGERSCSEPPPWLHDHRSPGDHPPRRSAALVRDRREHVPGVGPEPGILRSTLGPAGGVDSRTQRARLACLGDAVAPAQAVLALTHNLQALTASVWSS